MTAPDSYDRLRKAAARKAVEEDLLAIVAKVDAAMQERDDARALVDAAQAVTGLVRTMRIDWHAQYAELQQARREIRFLTRVAERLLDALDARDDEEADE